MPTLVPRLGDATSVSSDVLQYALGSLGCGIRRVLGEEVEETPRAELLRALATTFRGPEELKGALGVDLPALLEAAATGVGSRKKDL